jgi:hypothetical protein
MLRVLWGDKGKNSFFVKSLAMRGNGDGSNLSIFEVGEDGDSGF